jgi:hypothetical protein
MVNAWPLLLYQTVIAKCPEGINPASCFPDLVGFDPNDPKGKKAAAPDKAKASAM